MKKNYTTNKITTRNKFKISDYAQLDNTVIIDHFKTRTEGLTSKEADSRLEEFGLNQISIGFRDTVWSRLFESIINPFSVILMVIAVISFITDVVISAQKDYFTFIIIILLVFVSSMISFIQSQSSSKAVAKLTNQIKNTSHVYRDGKLIEIPQDQVVQGDIVHLGAGDMLPADIRFIQTKDTFIAQSALTGESTPVEKFSHQLDNQNLSLTDLDNIGFMGSNMISGSARGVVIATGDSTYFGSMAGSLTGDRAKNSFERGVDDDYYGSYCFCH